MRWLLCAFAALCDTRSKREKWSGEEEDSPFGYEGHEEEESEEEGECVEFAGYEGVYLSQITYKEVHEGGHEDEEDVDVHPPTDLHAELEGDHHVD